MREKLVALALVAGGATHSPRCTLLQSQIELTTANEVECTLPFSIVHHGPSQGGIAWHGACILLSHYCWRCERKRSGSGIEIVSNGAAPRAAPPFHCAGNDESAPKDGWRWRKRRKSTGTCMHASELGFLEIEICTEWQTCMKLHQSEMVDASHILDHHFRPSNRPLLNTPAHAGVNLFFPFSPLHR